MTDGTRLFVQALLARRVLPEKDAIKLCGRCLQEFQGR